jgi:signal peptidase I
MEPAFYRGDLLFLTNPPNQLYQTGDITVYKIPGADIPIVHRVLETHDTKPKRSAKSESVSAVPLSRQRLLTKGDNNYVDDIELYKGLEWLERKHIIGKVRGYVFFSGLTAIPNISLPLIFRFLPYVGYVTIAMVSAYNLKISQYISTIPRIERLPSTKICTTWQPWPSRSDTAGVTPLRGVANLCHVAECTFRLYNLNINAININIRPSLTPSSILCTYRLNRRLLSWPLNIFMARSDRIAMAKQQKVENQAMYCGECKYDVGSNYLSLHW